MTKKSAFDGSSIAQLHQLIEELNVANLATKTASCTDGSGSGETGDPGHRGGKSTHPTTKLDGNVHAATIGARGRENEKDVKEKVPNSPNSVPDNIASQGDNYGHVQIGMRVSATGEDPETEDAFQGSVEDPGTTSKITADAAGEKYASLSNGDLYKEGCSLIEDLLANIGAGNTFKEASSMRTSPTVDEAAAAGRALADAVASPDMIKQAQNEQIVMAIMQEAFDAADRVGNFLYKRAAEEAVEQTAEDPAAAAGAPPGAGGMPGMPGTPDTAGGVDPTMLAAGGPHGGDAAGGMGGGGDEEAEQAVNEAANALIDSGIPPEMIIDAVMRRVQQDEAAGGGGPEGAGAEKQSANRLSLDELSILYKVASNVDSLMQSGRFIRIPRSRLSKEALNERDGFSNYLSHVREVLNF